jgi:asparagine synthase (glutamine-hydrolysing)
MCGIAGFYHRDRERPAATAMLDSMVGTLVHRGPDGQGSLVDGALAIGMRRLAVIDVDHGQQPLWNEDRTIAAIQNGEIYNYRELRAELAGLGHRFATDSDTEVLVHGYEQWGDELVSRLNGMWAFAIWDRGRRRLLLSRDRLGIKPLHWTWDGDTLRFGSEIKALLAGGHPPDIDWETLDAYVAFGFVPEPYSMYRGVRKLPPGCNLVLQEQGTPQLRQYWEVPCVDAADARTDENTVVEEFRALLDDAVRLQMRSDVPLGAFLSGGLDSSSIVALASHHTPHPLTTITIGFAERDFDERALARQVAEMYRTAHHERAVESGALGRLSDVLRHHFDEPFGDSSALATYVVSGAARERVTVVLTGDGGDEVLAGYTRYQGEKFSQSYAGLPSFVRRRLLPGCVDLTRSAMRGRWRYRLDRAANVLETANMSFEDRVTRKQSWSSAESRRQLLRPQPNVRPAREYIDEVMRACPARDNLQRLNWFDLKMMLPGEMLTKVDRMSMAHSLEARVPFLDHRLVELMAGVSPAVKLRGYTRKHVLRRAMGSQLPPALLRARKRGFNVPVRDWFRTDAPLALLRRALGGTELDARLDRNALEATIDAHRRGAADHGVHLWIVLQLAAWQQHVHAEAVQA